MRGWEANIFVNKKEVYKEKGPGKQVDVNIENCFLSECEDLPPPHPPLKNLQEKHSIQNCQIAGIPCY